ncbi:hypothetical protein D3C71_1355160 [compost metagenome]
MQLALLIEQVGIHRRAADRAAMLATQYQRLRLTLVVRGDFVAWYEVDGRLAAFFRWQAVA